MARLTLGQKAERVLKLLLGLRHVPVARAFKAHGFGNADVAEGFRLLARLSCTDLDAVPPLPSAQAAADAELFEAWQKQWLPVAAASLKHRMPDAHAALFSGPKPPDGASGLSGVLQVSLFLKRFDALDRSKAQRGLGAAGASAKRLLEQRGLGPDVLARTREAVARAATLSDEPGVRADAASVRRAEEELWAWYLEWSAIGRMAIRDKRLLRALGLWNSDGGPPADDDDADLDASDAGRVEGGASASRKKLRG